MTRVHIICEGQTEETFVNAVLTPHLAGFGVFPSAVLIGKPGHKGGRVKTARLEKDVKNLLRDAKAYCTTFFDFYGIDSDFVGRAAALQKSAYEDKAQEIEVALRAHIARVAGENAVRRFHAYVQMYEFEALLFSDPEKMASGLSRPDLAEYFEQVRSDFDSPEEINDSPWTAPSKRILGVMEDYDKPLYGSLAALEIGLAAIRASCPRFDRWVGWLESPQPL